MRPLQII